MRNRIIKVMQSDSSWIYTENGADAHRTAGSSLADLFGVCGALRSREADDIQQMFLRAMAEDHLLAVKLAFYTRDIRGGLGERQTAKYFFRTLAKNYPHIMCRNLHLLPEFGRWDDLLCFLDTPVKSEAVSLIRCRLQGDLQNMLEGKPVSLLAKWLPSINASSRKTKADAQLLCREFGIDERTYRNVLSQLRAYLNVTERSLSMKTLDYIRYEQVSSNCMNRSRNAFMRRDAKRFQAYLEQVRSGKTGIHSSVLYPYDIVAPMLEHNNISSADLEVLEAQWKALPNYTDTDRNVLVMADVSGSMYGMPLASSVGLALYFAERNKGMFHNRFLTFSKIPVLEKVHGETLFEKVNHAKNADWEMNTDLEAAFNLVLEAAVKAHAAQAEIPEAILVISDMEIDRCTNAGRVDFTALMKCRFEEHGYTLPKVVYWNVAARHNVFHGIEDEENIILVSGHSAHTFSDILNFMSKTPEAFMKEVLNNPRYDCVTV